MRSNRRLSLRLLLACAFIWFSAAAVMAQSKPAAPAATVYQSPT
jgi:hypothetical protein